MHMASKGKEKTRAKGGGVKRVTFCGTRSKSSVDLLAVSTNWKLSPVLAAIRSILQSFLAAEITNIYLVYTKVTQPYFD
jgi:hypothetical protein